MPQTTSAYDPNAEQLQIAANANQATTPPTPRPVAQANTQQTPQANQQLPLASTSATPQQSQTPDAPALPSPTVQAPAKPVDRIALAADAWASFAKASDPYYQKSLRDATSNAAGRGQIGSGQLRTSLGDLSHQRQLELDTARDNLIRQATEGSIADATTAFQQQLAIAQQGLAGELGRGSLDVNRGQLDLARTGQEASLGLDRERLDLAREGQTASIDMQRAAQDLDERVRTGQMTIAERDQALRELQNTQSNTRADEQLELARTGQEATIDLQRRAQELDERVRTGQMTLAERDQALREAQQEQQAAQFTASLAENARQFGLSQEQQLEIAQLTDATQNRQLDLNSDLGRQNLLVQLANIVGGPTGNSAFLQEIARALGITLPNTNTNGTQPTTNRTTNPYGIDTSGLDTSGQDNPRPGGE